MWIAVLAGGSAVMFLGGWLALKIRDRRAKKADKYRARMEDNLTNANLAYDPKKINARRAEAIKDQIQ